MSQIIEPEAKLAYEALHCLRPGGSNTLPVATIECYTGAEDAQGRPHGIGVVSSSMGFLYTGQFEHGALAQQGRLSWVDGFSVTGNFCEGTVTGLGRLEWPCGDRYEGNLVNGVRHGDGVLASAGMAAGAVYSGQWARGRRHGQGRQLYADGSVYEGEWRCDRRHGTGTMQYVGSDCYVGQWVEGERHGHGVMGWRRGGPSYVELYDGEWQNGRPHGAGKSIYVRFLETSQGNTERNGGDRGSLSEELARCTDPRQYAPPVNSVINVYHGEYANGLREGQGTFYYADGSSYYGSWASGRKSGMGLFTTCTGAIHYGPFVDDELLDAPRLRELGGTTLVPNVLVDDLYGVTERAAGRQTATTVQSLLLRFNTALKALFLRYAALSDDTAFIFSPEDWWRHRIPGQLNFTQLLRLLSDAHIINGPVTISTVVQCAVATIRAAARVGSERLAPEANVAVRAETAIIRAYRLEGSMSYRTYAEVLVRLSNAVCLGQRFTTLAEKFNALVGNHLTATLQSCPLCPASRARSEELHSLAPALEVMFNKAVDLQLSHGERFLPVRQLVVLVRPLLARYDIALPALLRRVFPHDRHDSLSVSRLPGFNHPQTDLAREFYGYGCGSEGGLLATSVIVDQLLTLVDFVEAIVLIAEIICKKEGDASSVRSIIECEILTLPV